MRSRTPRAVATGAGRRRPAGRRRAEAALPTLDGASLDGAKGHGDSGDRARDPAELLAELEPFLVAAGVTRFADLTWLDRLGIPVVAAIRPNSSWNATDAGKGLTTAAARVSAAMEAIERHRVDLARPATVRARYSDLQDRGLAIPEDLLPLSLASVFHRDVAEDWVIAGNLLDGSQVALPACTVGGPPPRARGEADGYNFQPGSNGLASGAVLGEAVCAALYEVIERDAVARWAARANNGSDRGRLALGSVPDGQFAAWCARCRAADVLPVVFDCASDLGVPTYACYLVDERAPQASVYVGYGAHLDPQTALIRALIEAAQSRAVLLAGARDDLTWSAFRHHWRVTTATTARELSATPASVTFADGTAGAGATLGADLVTLLGRIRDAGLPCVGVVRLGGGELGPPVVRVSVPGLDGYPHVATYAPVGTR